MSEDVPTWKMLLLIIFALLCALWWNTVRLFRPDVRR